MKTKKVLLIGIAVFAISLLLTSSVLANEDETLDIYGNANEDDTIDMRDLTYVKLIFFGKKPETELSDAKYDGKINPLDFVQIKLIIVGKEKQLTVVDTADRIVTVNKPVKRVIAFYTYFVEPLRTLDAADKIVGVEDYTKKSPKVYLGEICDLPSLGSSWSPDYEALFILEPDLVLIATGSYADTCVDTIESNDPDLPILRMVAGSGERVPFKYVEEMRKLGYVFGKREEAEEFIDWYAGITDLIKSRTDELSDDEKPRVLYGNLKKGGKEWFTFSRNSGTQHYLEMAGARNIAVDVFGEKGHGYVDLEWVIVQDPEIVVRYYYPGIRKCYVIDDTTEIIEVRDEVLNHPALAEVDAVMNKEVQMISSGLMGGARHLIGIAYLAKTFHPDLFDDLDPQAIHQEWLTRFQRIDYDLDEHGVFVYPEP